MTASPQSSNRGERRAVARVQWTAQLAHDPSVRERSAFLAGWDAAVDAAADQPTGGCAGRESCEITCCMDEHPHAWVDEFIGTGDRRHLRDQLCTVCRERRTVAL